MNCELFLFIFTMVFSFNIHGIDLKIPLYVFWLLEIGIERILKGNREIKIDLYIYKLISLMIAIVCYIIFITLINEKNELNVVLRYFRGIISFIIITIFFQDKKYKSKEVIKTIEIILLIHAISVILGVIFPSFKESIVFISNYRKKFISARSTGLVSGYDFAGLLCNLGLILNLLRNILFKKKVVNIKTILFVIGALFTSRYSMVMAVSILVIAFIYEIFKINIKEIIRLGKYIIPLFLGVYIFLVLTTDLNVDLRIELINKFPVMKEFYNDIIYSYADYLGRNTVSNHYYISIGMKCIFGAGYLPSNIDPGYVKNLYYIGIFGIAIEMIFYLSIFFYVNRMRKITLNKNIKVGSLFLMFMIICLFIMEFKLSFIFSSITFELMIILLVYLINYNKQTRGIGRRVRK